MTQLSKDELKKKSRGQVAAPNKVVKSSSANLIGSKIVKGQTARRATNGSVASRGKAVPMDTEVQSGRVTIGKNIRSMRLANKPIPTVTISNKTVSPRTAVSKNGAQRNSRPNSATSIATNVSAPNKKQSPLQKAIETARSVVANPRHPKHNDVKTLLESHQKKFISDARFVELLKTLLF